MNKAAHQFLVTTVTAKHQEANQAVQQFLHVMFANSNPDARKNAVHKAITATEELQSVVHENYRPPWLARIISNLRRFESQPQNQNGINAVHAVATSDFPVMSKHQWDFSEPQPAGFDFDQIFNDARNANQIPQLFDEIISCLQEISDSGAIDSIRIINELNAVIATLKNAKNGSYLATRHGWDFLVAWLKETGWEAFGDLPVIGAPVRALKSTLEKTNTAMDQMHADMHEKIAISTEKDLPKLTYDPPKLPAPEPDETSGDVDSDAEST